MPIGSERGVEPWDAACHSSRNYFVLGHIMEWFYSSLAGIVPDESTPGFRNVIVQSQPVEGID